MCTMECHQIMLECRRTAHCKHRHRGVSQAHRRAQSNSMCNHNVYIFIRLLKSENRIHMRERKTCCLTSILSCSFPISLMFLSLFRFSHGKLIYFAPQTLEELLRKLFISFLTFLLIRLACARARFSPPSPSPSYFCFSLPPPPSPPPPPPSLPFYFVPASTCFNLSSEYDTRVCALIVPQLFDVACASIVHYYLLVWQNRAKKKKAQSRDCKA